MPILFGTVKLRIVQSAIGDNQVTAICDNGSSVNLITQQAVKRLGLSAKKIVVDLIGLQNEPLPGTSGRIQLTLKSNNSANLIKGTFYVV